MNAVLNYINDNRLRFGFNEDISLNDLSCLVLTPRFPTSNHLIYLVMQKDTSEPLAVAKIPRQIESSGLAQEASNLLSVQKYWTEGASSVPRLLAFETFLDRFILIETAINGYPMDQSQIRKDLSTSCSRTISWLAGLHQRTRNSSSNVQNWYDRLIREPLQYFESYFPLNEKEHGLLKSTYHIAEDISETEFPLVLEHGDMSNPNLLVMGDGKLGVLDWETARINGLPYCDLFFFLNYAAASMERAKSSDSYLRAFTKAFYNRESWALPYIKLYKDKLPVAPHSTSAFFILCWARYTIGSLERMLGKHPAQIANKNITDWLRSDRYYRFWQYSVDHYDQFAC